MERRARAMAIAVGVAVVAGWTAGVEAAEIKVLSAGAMRAIVTELAQTFHQETGHTVTLTFGTVGELRQKASAGEPADVVIVTDAAIAELAAQGIVARDSRADIARVAIGLAVREGAPRPDISTPGALKQTLLAAKSVVYVNPALGATSGIHFASVLERLGIADEVKKKSVLVPGGFAAEVVARGEAELCVHQISEILPVKGVTLVGPFPRELQKITTYSAVVPTRSPTPELGRAFIAFLARPSFKPKLAAAGLDYHE